MKVLLVGNPRTVKGFDRLTKLPSLNLASLAANVEEGVAEIRIVDLVVKNRHPLKVLQRVLSDFQPDVAGFTAMSFQYETALDLIKATRLFNPRIITVLGGYHATADGEQILAGNDHQYIDLIIDGEGEVTFNALLKSIRDKTDYSSVPGILYRLNGKVQKTARASLLPPEQIRIPRRDLRIFKKGFHVLGEPGDVIETSRGCVYDCNFCSIRNMYGKSFRKFSIERILEDLEDARRNGARSVFITDDNITLDGRRLQHLCNEIAGTGLNMKFAVQASVRGFIKNPELAREMARAGTKIVFLGIENASDSALEFMHKSNQLKSSDTLKVVRELKKYGILVVGGFIFGYPDDNEHTLLENYRYALKMGIDIPLFNILTPHLKTGLRDELLKEGLVTNQHDYSLYNHYHCNVRTKNLTGEELYRLRNKLDARYPLESGAVFRLFRTYPLFFSGLMFKMLRDEPRNWFNFATGLLRS